MNHTPLDLTRLHQIYSIRQLTDTNLILFMIGVTFTNFVLVMIMAGVILTHRDEVSEIKMKLIPNKKQLEVQSFYNEI